MPTRVEVYYYTRKKHIYYPSIYGQIKWAWFIEIIFYGTKYLTIDIFH